MADMVSDAGDTDSAMADVETVDTMETLALILLILIGIPVAVIYGRFVVALILGIWFLTLKQIGFTFDQKKVDALLERIAPNIFDD